MEPDSTCPDFLASSGAVSDVVFLEAERPALTRIGRFMILSEIGRGGMGIVLAAYDPELHRELAIKLLRKSGRGEATQRLLREAQALAQLTHPNVVAIHDVGTYGDDVFIVMERVVGVTLRAWLAAGPRPWREILARLVDAGRGLAAAHAAGLVHRDVKPDNIMIGDDGRVCVMDFGLAREAPDREALEQDLGGALDLSLTRAGTFIGTPGYMAPEQFSGGTSDARTDIFGFCVVMHEALYGSRPFTGTNVDELRRQVLAGERAPVPAPSPVPGWVRAVIERGLKRQPEERWQTMAGLLAAIADDPGVRRRRWLLAGGVVAVAIATLGGFLGQEALRVRRCEAEGAAILADWDDSTRLRLRDNLSATGIEQAPDIAARVERGLDSWTDGWRASRAAACQDPDELADARSVCQERLRFRLRLVIEVLLQARDRAAVFRATEQVASLPSFASCDEASALAGQTVLRAGPLRERVELELALLTRARLSRDGFNLESNALAVAEQVLAVADELGEPSLRAEAIQTNGWIELMRGRYAVGESHMRAAYFLALEHGLDLQAATAATGLIYALLTQVRYKEALEWGHHCGALLRRNGQEGSITEQRRQSLLLAVALSLGDHEAAADHVRRSSALAEALFGPEHPMVADSLYEQAMLAQRSDDALGAVELARKGLAICEATLGPDAPRSMRFHMALSGALSDLGRTTEAIEAARRALALGERVFGPEHPDLGVCLEVLAAVLMETADEEALVVLHRSLALKQRILGPEHPRLVSIYGRIGKTLHRLGRPTEALEPLERGLALVSDTPAESGEPASLRLELGKALWASGRDRRRARALVEEAHHLALALPSDPLKFKDQTERWLAEHPLP